MPSYKLTYFNGKGRGELVRLLFAAAGTKFEDQRIDFSEWAALKEKTPQGSLPVLEVDGKVKLCQSQAVARYLAREFGMYGKTNMDNGIVDQIMDTCLDPFTKAVGINFEKDEAKKAEDSKQFTEETIPKYYGFLEDLIKQAGCDGFSVGKSLTVADLCIFILSNQIVAGFVKGKDAEDLCKKFSKVAAVVKKVESLPRIKEYLAKRPETAF